MITADQLVAHAVGDYLLQSDWMANGKTLRLAPAAVHAFVYSLTFLVFSPSFTAWAVIFWTHLVIDHWRLARYVVWAKNWIGLPDVVRDAQDRPQYFVGPGTHWRDSRETGYHKDRPAWLAVWLLIIADNILHVLINGAALAYL